MSKAYICDRCGKMLPADGSVKPMMPIWLRSPFVRDVIGDDEAQVHLCQECYAKFEDEFLENLRESGMR